VKRVMCVYLPKWPLQRLRHDRPELRDKSVALVNRQIAARPQVTFCSAQASRRGVRPGMPLAEAVTIDPTLCAVDEDPKKDALALQRMLKWAERYSPLFGLEETDHPSSLLVDISGCAPCFHGEDRLLKRAHKELTDEGWTARVAIAATIGAAWGLAHWVPGPWSLVPGPTRDQGPGTRDLLSPLPVAALRLPADTLALLAELGLDSIGQLLSLPRADLTSRFGPILLQRLDQALGLLPETLTPRHSVPPLQATWSFEPPTDKRQALHYALDQLTTQLHQVLQKRYRGVRQMECWLYHETAAPLRVEVNFFRPSHALDYLRMMARTQLEQAPIAEAVCGMRLHVCRTEALCDCQENLFALPQAHGQPSVGLAVLIDRLGSRLGYETIQRAVLMADAQPEYACRLEPLFGVSAALPSGSRQNEDHLRPLRLWPRPLSIQVVSVVPDGPPVRFRWSGVDYQVTRAWGPERIETGWWRCEDVQRDYYMVATQLGNRFWLFRRRDDGRWFLHGCFD
jgi:protein ImuB